MNDRTIHKALYMGGLSVFTQDANGRIKRVMFIHADGSFEYESEFDKLTQSEIDYINANKYKWYKSWQEFEKNYAHQPMPKC